MTNSSTGALGVKIANEFLVQKPDAEIIFLHGKGSRVPQDPRIRLISIGSTQDLLETLESLPEPQIVVHSMAVSDYSVECMLDEDGNELDLNSKVSSSLEHPCILLKKTPKVIGRIKKMWPHTFLVGFKLLNQVTEDELFDVAFKLLRKNRCNLVLANDIADIRAGNHCGLLVYPEKTRAHFSGKDEIARKLVETTLIRQAVHHHISVMDAGTDSGLEIMMEKGVAPYLSRFYEVGEWLWSHFFLPAVETGTYGNMSMNLGHGTFVMTGRNVNKGDLTRDDLVRVTYYKQLPADQEVVGEIHYYGKVKPSIDAPIHAQIYAMRPDVKAMIHVHTFVNFPDLPSTSYNFPCGCEEEVQALTSLIRDNPESSILQMVNHGLLILGESLEDCRDKLEQLYQQQLPKLMPSLCYHATYMANIPAILEEGLVPGKHMTWRGIDHQFSYLVNGDCDEDPIELAADFCEAADNVPDDIYDSGIVILGIPRDKLNNYYLDPNMLSDDGNISDTYLMVQDRIPPEHILFIKSR